MTDTNKMTKFYETSKFLALQKEWRKKLKESGFEDEEDNNGLLKVSTNTRLKAAGPVVAIRAKVEYYTLAGKFLHDHMFKNQADHNAWKLHAQGLGWKAIAKKLNLSTAVVRGKIERLRTIMLTKYNAGQDDES